MDKTFQEIKVEAIADQEEVELLIQVDRVEEMVVVKEQVVDKEADKVISQCLEVLEETKIHLADKTINSDSEILNNHSK